MGHVHYATLWPSRKGTSSPTGFATFLFPDPLRTPYTTPSNTTATVNATNTIRTTKPVVLVKAATLLDGMTRKLSSVALNSQCCPPNPSVQLHLKVKIIELMYRIPY